MLSGCYLSHIFINLCLSDSNILTKVLKCISTNIWLQHGGYVHLFYAVHYYNATILFFFFFTFYKCSTKLLNVIQLYTKGHDYLLHSEHSKMVKKNKNFRHYKELGAFDIVPLSCCFSCEHTDKVDKVWMICDVTFFKLSQFGKKNSFICNT